MYFRAFSVFCAFLLRKLGSGAGEEFCSFFFRGVSGLRVLNPCSWSGVSQVKNKKDINQQIEYRTHPPKKRFNEEVFASQERVSGFPEKGADLWGSPGNLRGSSGNFRASLGNFRGTPWIAVKFTVRSLPRKSPRNFRGSSGELPGKSGDFPEARGSLTPPPATRQICLQSYGIKVGFRMPYKSEFVCHKSRFVHHILCGSPFISRDFYAIRTLISWHILFYGIFWEHIFC